MVSELTSMALVSYERAIHLLEGFDNQECREGVSPETVASVRRARPVLKKFAEMFEKYLITEEPKLLLSLPGDFVLPIILKHDLLVMNSPKSKQFITGKTTISHWVCPDVAQVVNGYRLQSMRLAYWNSACRAFCHLPKEVCKTIASYMCVDLLEIVTPQEFIRNNTEVRCGERFVYTPLIYERNANITRFLEIFRLTGDCHTTVFIE